MSQPTPALYALALLQLRRTKGWFNSSRESHYFISPGTFLNRLFCLFGAPSLYWNNVYLCLIDLIGTCLADVLSGLMNSLVCKVLWHSRREWSLVGAAALAHTALRDKSHKAPYLPLLPPISPPSGRAATLMGSRTIFNNTELSPSIWLLLPQITT